MEQESLFSGAGTAARDAFGCCSSYRVCSDARHCVIADRDYSANCIYRRNLESGRIFYGKNAQGFVMSEYEEYRARIQSLDADAQAVYYSLLNELHYWNRCARFICIRRTADVDTVSAAGLVSLSSAYDYMTGKLGPRKLEAHIRSGYPARYEQWKEAHQPKIGLLVPWIQTHAPEVIADWDVRYCLASTPEPLSRYAEEVFQDDCIKTVRQTGRSDLIISLDALRRNLA